MLDITHQGNKGGKGKQTHSPKLLCSFILMLNQDFCAITKLMIEFCLRTIFINEINNQWIRLRMINYQIFTCDTCNQV